MIPRSNGPALCALVVLCVLLPTTLFLFPVRADQRDRFPRPPDGDPCGLPDTTTAAYRAAAAQNWGYGYDSLLADLERWSQSPFVRIDSVGASVQNRALFMLTIQAAGESADARRRVWIHARTHPGEVQGTWVTNEIIKQLLGPSDVAALLRRTCVFNIIPMINPDGVELKLPRQNAHNVDIESNWTAVPGEPEVQTLRRMFGLLMGQANPIRIALNMHSALGEKRYFVYHAAAGTSQAYSVIEQRFINGVRSYFPGGIQPYDYFVSWTTAPSLSYPESWFWQNHREAVLALTYEDMNSTAARAFDSTANAILRGIADELGVTGAPVVALREESPSTISLEQNFPNPFNPATTIRYTIPSANAGNRETGARRVELTVHDVLGRTVATLVDEMQLPGTYAVRFDGSTCSSGMYLCRLAVHGRTLDGGGEASGGRVRNAPETAFRVVRMALTR